MPAHAALGFAFIQFVIWAGQALFVVSSLYTAYVLLSLLGAGNRNRKRTRAVGGLLGGLVFTSAPFGVLLYLFVPELVWEGLLVNSANFVFHRLPGAIQVYFNWLPQFTAGFLVGGLLALPILNWRRAASNARSTADGTSA